MPLSSYTCYKRHKYNVGCWNILRKSYIYRNTQVDVEVDATLRYPTAANTQVNVPCRRPSLAPTLHWASFFTQVYATLREPSLPNAGLRSLTQAYAALRRSFVEDSQAYADEFVNWEYAGLRRLTLPFVRYSVSPPLGTRGWEWKQEKRTLLARPNCDRFSIFLFCTGNEWMGFVFVFLL